MLRTIRSARSSTAIRENTQTGDGKSRHLLNWRRSVRRALLVVSGIVLSTSLSVAQLISEARLNEAYRLEKQGESSQAIQLIEALLKAPLSTPEEYGKAWNILGLALSNEGQFSRSRHAFEQSLRAYESSGKPTSDYAIALTDLGDLEALTENFDPAMKLITHARRIFEAVQDHAGVARTCSGLTGVLLSQGRLREGERTLNCATKASSQANDLDAEDEATLSMLRGWLAQSQGSASKAVVQYQQSVNLLTKLHGEHMSTGWGLVLLGRAHWDAGEQTKSLDEMDKGVGILCRTLKIQDPRLLAAQLAYAHLLDRSGRKAEAKVLKGRVEEQQSAPGQECLSCFVSAKAYR